MNDADIWNLAYRTWGDPDIATTMTAIALAESGGDPSVNAQGPEDSRGLWQVNVRANQQTLDNLGITADQLYDPEFNAQAALVIGGGEGQVDVSRWSVALSQPPKPIGPNGEMVYSDPSLPTVTPAFRRYAERAQGAAQANGFMAQGDFTGSTFMTNRRYVRASETPPAYDPELQAAYLAQNPPASGGEGLPENESQDARSSAASGGDSPLALPEGAQVVEVGDRSFIVFEYGTEGDGWYYEVTEDTPAFVLDGVTPVQYTEDEWAAIAPEVPTTEGDRGILFDAGDAGILFGPEKPFDGSFTDFINSTLDLVLGKYHPGRQDPSLVRWALGSATQMLSEQEVELLYQRSEWVRSRNEKQREWAGLSEAERKAEADQYLVPIMNEWMSMYGYERDLTLEQARAIATTIASGEQGYGEWFFDAQSDARTVVGTPAYNDYRELVGGRTADIDEQVNAIRKLAKNYLIPMGKGMSQSADLLRLAEEVVDQFTSLDDIEVSFAEQAAALFPSLAVQGPDGRATVSSSPRTFASVFKDSWNSLMEETVDEYDDHVMTALKDGQSIGDFESAIKRSRSWQLGTSNGMAQTESKMAQLARQMGFQ